LLLLLGKIDNMPCRNEQFEPDLIEKELSKVYSFLYEARDGKKWQQGDLMGFHGDAYGNASQEKLDKATAELCAFLREKDVTKYSLELQIWWRDHQKLDAKREKKEKYSNISGADFM